MEDELLKKVGATIRLIRESRGYSQEAFARGAGIDRAHYGRIERGAANITLKALFRLAAELETSPADFLTYLSVNDVQCLKRDPLDLTKDKLGWKI